MGASTMGGGELCLRGFATLSMGGGCAQGPPHHFLEKKKGDDDSEDLTHALDHFGDSGAVCHSTTVAINRAAGWNEANRGGRAQWVGGRGSTARVGHGGTGRGGSLDGTRSWSVREDRKRGGGLGAFARELGGRAAE